MNKLSLAKAGFLFAAAISFLLSVYLWFSGSKDQGVFVGIWVPSILSLGALMLSGSACLAPLLPVGGESRIILDS